MGRLHQMFFILIAGMLALSGCLAFSIFRDASKLRQLESTRYKLFSMGEELKASSENLTNYCRSFVLTRERVWEQKYFDLLDVRNGVKPWPNGHAISLKDSLLKLGISKQEFVKLMFAEDKSNELVATEKRAFNAMRGLFTGSNKQFSIKGAPDTLMARRILFDKSYMAAKKTIMDPIDDFRGMMNNRISAEIKQQEVQNDMLMKLILLTLFSGALLSFYVILVLRKKIIVQLFDLEKSNQELELTLQDLKKTQLKLVKSAKMASLGTLTAGVSHEINNPLNYIMGAYLGLSNYFENYGSQEESITNLLLNSMKAGVDKAAQIVKGLNQFSRDNSRFDEDCDIHSILDNCLIMHASQLKHKTEVKKDYCLEDFVVKGNVGKLHQVFANVLSNAIYALPEQGKICIATRKETQNVKVIITDNGCGIQTEHLSQITDPFFTTKPPGEGAGLGLYITSSIIDKHLGQIEFESTLHAGTKVIITLPIA
ncbi:His Kinase A (phospho-acceptor) domain-containing protein [Solitalea koreensis]|uniref:histidine kinase n=2 Tax=Solitalea koreensis TaxID=543615 RepID=A0A521ADN4_9SPHI|nr:His Kinase A (phospho-acceptor) domain-containing protein [Solitalea koreensis]